MRTIRIEFEVTNKEAKLFQLYEQIRADAGMKIFDRPIGIPFKNMDTGEVIWDKVMPRNSRLEIVGEEARGNK